VIGMSGVKAEYELLKETGPAAKEIDLAPHVGREVEVEARAIEVPAEAPPGVVQAAPAAPAPAPPQAKPDEPEKIARFLAIAVKDVSPSCP
jgi:hypothetical protein